MSSDNSNGASPPRPSEGRGFLQVFNRTPVSIGLLLFTGLVFLAQNISIALVNEDWLLYYGVKFRPLMLEGQWWRLITPIFLHLDLTHFFVWEGWRPSEAETGARRRNRRILWEPSSIWPPRPAPW